MAKRTIPQRPLTLDDYDAVFGRDAGAYEDPIEEAAPVKKAEKRTWGDAATDFGRGMASGVGGLVGGAGTLYGLATGDMENGATELGDSVKQYWEGGQSQQLKDKKKARQVAIDAADGTLSKAGTALWESISDPALAADMVASNLATMLPGAAAGRVVAGAKYASGLNSAMNTGPVGLVAREALGKAAGAAGTGTAIGVGALQQGADVSGEVYKASMAKPDDVWLQNPEFVQAVQASDQSPQAIADIKHAFALSAARATLPAAAAISAGTSLLPGGAAIEKMLVGGGAREAVKAGTRYALPKAIAKGAVGEMTQEGLEEGGGAFAGNIAKQLLVDPNQSLSEGVGENAGMGMAGGLLLGGMSGVAHGQAENPVATQLQAQIDKGNSPLSRAVQATSFQDAGAPTGAAPGMDPPLGQAIDSVLQPADAGFLTPADSASPAAPIADNFEANQAAAHEPLAQAAIESIATEAPVADAEVTDDKTKWLKAITDQNRTAGDTGVQLTVSEDGQLTFLGNPKATRQGLALEATLQEALKAGATVPDIVTHLSQPVVEATAPAPLVGEPINQRWTAFHPASGTLNVPRAEMPQIKSEHRGAMVNFLKARGIGGEAETVAATDLKPTQTEFSPSKVKKAMDYVGGDRPVLVSSDGYVLDGHHQWLAKAQQDVPVAITRLNAPIKDLLVAMRDFPSAGMTKEAAKDGRTQVQAPVAEAAPVSPGNPGNQPIRARRAALTQLASQGFSQVESDALGHRLVNPESNTEVVLDSSFDALLAKQAIANYTGQQTTGVQNGQETGAASAGVDSRGSTEAGVNPRDGGVRYSTEQSKRDGRELPGGATSDQRQTDTARQGVERLAANNATRVSEAHRDINDHRNDLIAQYHASTDQVERGRIYDEVAHLPAMGHPPAAELQAFSEMAHNWSITMGGRPPVAYWDQSSSASDGFEQYGNTYVNLANPTMALQWTIGHEAEHGQEKTATQEEQALRVELWNEVTPQGRAIFFENFLFKGKKYANATPRQLAKLKSEMLAEFNGELFTNVDWLNKLQKQKPNLFGKFVSEWIPTLSRMIDSLKSRYGVGQDSPKSVMKFMRDLESAKDIAMKIAISWAERNPKLAQSTGAGAAIQHSARATDEYTDVESRLKGTEQWLKAPNGQATKLTERQWVQTRTPSFKNWFGDFEAFAKLPGGVWNDDKGAVSKAVDANGDPVIVYHGTDKGGFMSFQQPGGERRGDLGIFTTSNEGMAHSYVRKGRANRIADPGLSDVAEWWNDEGGANEEIPFGDLTDKDVAAAAERYWDEVAQYEDKKAGVYAAFVNLRNPNETDFEGALWNGSREHQYIVLVDGETMVRKDGKQYFDDEDEAKAFAREFPNPLYEDDDGSDYVRQALDEHWETTDGAVREGRQNKNDGTIIRQVVDDGGGPGYDLTPSDVFIAFSPNQIKSADFNTGEFGETDDIRYSAKVQSEKDDSKVGNLTSVAERGTRIVGTRATFTQDEKQAVKDSSEKIGVSEKEITATVRGHKLAHPTTQGWEPLVFSSAKIEVDDKGKRKVVYNYKTTAYSFSSDSSGKPIDAGSPAHKKRVSAVAKAMTDEVRRVFQRAANNDQNAKNILAQAGWYKAMRARLRHEFGGIGDLFADLLGATSPNTPVRDNWTNAIDSLRRASRGDYDTLIPQWEAWADKVDALELDLRGWFNERLAEGLNKKTIHDLPDYKSKTDALKLIRKLDDSLLPTKESGKKYGFNGKNVARAMVDLWRTVKNADVDVGRGSTAPKALNFSGNLIGFRGRATIDVWAARMLQRLAGGDRIPSMAETGVSGAMREDATTTLQFGMGQDIFGAAAKMIRADEMLKTDEVLATVNDDDLQAVVWFIEKELWTVNNWTSSAGEGGSFELEASLSGSADQVRIKDLRRIIDSSKSKPEARVVAKSELATLERTVDRFVGGLSTQMSMDTQGIDFIPTDSDMARLGEAVRLAAYEADGSTQVLASKMLSTQGRYGGIERSLDMEVVAREGYDAAPLWGEMLRQAQAAKQDSTFLSRVLRDGEDINPLRHRPGVEIYFREAASAVKLEEVLLDLKKEGVEFLTVIVDGRRMPGAVAGEMPAAVGVRLQYVPEFDQRYGFDDLSGLNDAELTDKINAKAIEMESIAIRVSGSVDGVAFAGQFWHDTQVAFSHQYQEKINGLATDATKRKPDQIRGSGWSGQSIRSGIEDANRQARETARRESDVESRADLGGDAQFSARIDGSTDIQRSGSLDPALHGQPPRYGSPREGSSSAVGYHFSRQARTSLSSDHYGTGLKGAESERLTGQVNADIRPRVFFYVSKGNGVRAESGVGAYGHHVQLDNLYDIQQDPLGLIVKTRGMPGDRANNWERAILEAGFDGYLHRDPVMPQGFAVLLGKKHGAVPVAQTQAPGANPNPVVEKPKSQNDLTAEGNELVRKPTPQELMGIIANRPAIKAAAPSFAMQYGSARVLATESEAADQAFSDAGTSFRFGALSHSLRDESALEAEQAIQDAVVSPRTGRYAGKKVNVPVKIEDTGEVATLTMDVYRTLDETDVRKANILELIGCLK